MRNLKVLTCSAVVVATLAAGALAQDSAAGGIDARPGPRGAASGQLPQAPRAPDTFGTNYVSYYDVDAFELVPYTSAATYSGINNGQLRYLTNVAGFALEGAVALPLGALVTYIELDYYDSSATGQAIASLGVCDLDGISCTFQFGNCGGAATICSTAAENSGYSFTTADLTAKLVVNNFLKRYVILAGNTTTDGTTAISKVIIGYRLQVSDAPGSPTFNDVPASDLGFQYIEALVASGITGGTGGGNFSPNAFVTRRQMAIFLAKALGLQWY